MQIPPFGHNPIVFNQNMNLRGTSKVTHPFYYNVAPLIPVNYIISNMPSNSTLNFNPPQHQPIHIIRNNNMPIQ
jgi:hypothetical protein